MTAPATLRFGRGEASIEGWPFALERLAATGAAAPPEALADAAEVGLAAAERLACSVGHGRIAVAVPDRTRPFPRGAVLAPLLDELRRRDLGPDRVDVLVARGQHGGEAPADLGDLAVGVHLHDCRGRHLVEPPGHGTLSWPVRLATLWVGAGARLSLGTAGFHYLAGFGGGRKTIAPGLAAKETIEAIHMAALGPDGRRHPGLGCGRLDGNPVHERAAAVAALAPPDVAVEHLATPDGPRFLVGAMEAVHRRGAAWVASARAFRVPGPRRLVVASAGGHPRDRDLIQSHKALEHLREALLPGGTAVLFAACDDGPGHPDLLAYGALGSAAGVAAALRERYAVYGQTAWALREKAERHDLILVSRLDPSTVRSLGMRPAASSAEALAAVLEALPRGEPGWVVPDAGAEVARA